jgi:DNA-binding winged helix-turn-helix (wHTH) protein
MGQEDQMTSSTLKRIDSAAPAAESPANEVRIAVLTFDERLRVLRPRVYRFGDFVLLPELYEVRWRGERVAIAPKVFDLLLHLIENRDRVVTHADLHAALWPDVTVTEDSLTYTVMAARRALGDSGRTQTVIRSVRSRGYRFVAGVVECSFADDSGHLAVR